MSPGCSCALARGERVPRGAGDPAQPDPHKPSTQLLFSLRAFYPSSSQSQAPAPPHPIFAGWDSEGVNWMAVPIRNKRRQLNIIACDACIGSVRAASAQEQCPGWSGQIPKGANFPLGSKHISNGNTNREIPRGSKCWFAKDPEGTQSLASAHRSLAPAPGCGTSLCLLPGAITQHLLFVFLHAKSKRDREGWDGAEQSLCPIPGTNHPTEEVGAGGTAEKTPIKVNY